MATATEEQTEAADGQMDEVDKAEERRNAHYQEILAQNALVILAIREHDDAKFVTSLAKKQLDNADRDLIDLIARGPDMQDQLPFGDDEPEEWRDVELKTLGLSDSTIQAMADHNPKIITVGDMADFTAEFAMSDIKGIGPVALELIEDVMTDFWAERNDKPEAEDDEEENGDDTAE